MSGSNPLQAQPPSPNSNPLVAVPGQPDPLDFTGKYNTKLSPADETKFQAWAKAADRQPDLYDYDLRGAWKSDAQAADNGHLPDIWKKPNHPTFSDESIYHGVDGYNGGTWNEGAEGSPVTFTPGATNLRFRSPVQLQRYFQAVEPDATLILPAAQVH